MSNWKRWCAAFALGACVLPLTSLAHEDDPKILDRQPPYPGRGLRTGVPGAGGVDYAVGVTGGVFASNGIQLMSWMSLEELGYPANANSLWGYTSPSGREYAILGHSDGTAFVEVTNPGDPTIVAQLAGPGSLWRDMRVYQNYSYSVSEGGEGIQVFDLSQIDAGIVTHVNTVTTGGVASTHTVTIDETSGFLYRCGGDNNGLRIYSLANPANPTLVATWPDRYVHEAQVVTYTSGPYAGKQIAFCCSGYNGGWNSTGVDILDVTNKSSIVLIKRFFYSNPGYSHQAWLSPNKQYMYLDDEKDEQNIGGTTITKVFDVSNLSNPIEKPSFTNASSAIGHNLYTKGNRIFEANYRSGLRVFDSTNPLAPVEIAWFDTYPDDDDARFNGLWNTYPYFASGTVIGSDIERGLFVWWVGAPLVQFAFPAGQPEPIDPAGATIAVDVNASPGTLVPGTAMLHYDLGAGYVTVPLTSLGGAQFQAALPATSCGKVIDYYYSAQSSNGFTWTSPAGGPVNHYQVTAALSTSVVTTYDMESDAGWVSGMAGDNANTGEWTRFDPVGTPSQPDFDHSQVGVNCWFTEQGHGLETMDAHDVDGGKTTLLSPVLDLSAVAQPYLRYWRWYSNMHLYGEHEDVFVVEISNDGGSSWVPVETVGPTGHETEGGWYLHQFRVADFVAPTANVRVRFIASDNGVPSVVEAAIDDFEVVDIACPAVAQVYCTAKPNSLGCTPSIAFSGAPSASSASAFELTASNVLSGKSGLLFYGYGANASPFQGGTLCVNTPTKRTPLQVAGGTFPPSDCSGTFTYDFNARIQGGVDPNLVPGAVVNAQYWSRDGGDPTGFGTGLTDAVEFTVAP